MADSIREAMENAWSDLEAGEATGERPLETIVPDEPVLSAGNGAPSRKEAPAASEEQVIPEEKTEVKPAIRPAQRQEQKAGQQKPSVRQSQRPLDERVADKAGKPPASWKPTARVHWDKVPAEIRDEIVRRELQTEQALTMSESARKFNDEFQRVVSPFEGLMRASGVSQPLVAVQNLMTTAATLQTGTPAQKAATVANIIKAYGVDIASLDAVLAGQQPKPGAGSPDAILQAIDLRLRPVTEFMGRFQQQGHQQQQQIQQEAQQTLDQFMTDPKNEFAGDLSEDIADLLELNAKRGRTMTLQQAYDLAAKNHPEVSKVLADREAAEAATRRAGGLSRARRAAASQTQGSPAAVGASQAKPKGTRAAINQAWDDLSAAG